MYGQTDGGRYLELCDECTSRDKSGTNDGSSFVTCKQVSRRAEFTSSLWQIVSNSAKMAEIIHLKLWCEHFLNQFGNWNKNEKV